MTWGDVALIVVSATAAMSIFAAGVVWLLAKGTDPGRPTWQPIVVGVLMIAYFSTCVAVLTKLTIDGVI